MGSGHKLHARLALLYLPVFDGAKYREYQDTGTYRSTPSRRYSGTMKRRLARSVAGDAAAGADGHRTSGQRNQTAR